MHRSRTDRPARDRPTGFEVLGEHQPACTSALILGGFPWGVNFAALLCTEEPEINIAGSLYVRLTDENIYYLMVDRLRLRGLGTSHLRSIKGLRSLFLFLTLEAIPPKGKVFVVFLSGYGIRRRRLACSKPSPYWCHSCSFR